MNNSSEHIAFLGVHIYNIPSTMTCYVLWYFSQRHHYMHTVTWQLVRYTLIFFSGLTLCVLHFCTSHIKFFMWCYASHQACIFFLVDYDWSSIFSAETTEHLPVNIRFLLLLRKQQQTTGKACSTTRQLTPSRNFLRAHSVTFKCLGKQWCVRVIEHGRLNILLAGFLSTPAPDSDHSQPIFLPNKSTAEPGG